MLTVTLKLSKTVCLLKRGELHGFGVQQRRSLMFGVQARKARQLCYVGVDLRQLHHWAHAHIYNKVLWLQILLGTGCCPDYWRNCLSDFTQLIGHMALHSSSRLPCLEPATSKRSRRVPAMMGRRRATVPCCAAILLVASLVHHSSAAGYEVSACF